MILRAKREQLAQAAILAAELWPDSTPEGLAAELEQLAPSEGAGFDEAGRIVCFTKKLRSRREQRNNGGTAEQREF